MTRFDAGEWPVSYTGTGCSAFDESGMEETQELFERIAADLLWNFTGRYFGTITEIVRPCRVSLPWRPSTFEGLGPPAAYYELGIGTGWGWLPAYSNGSWHSIYCGRCGTAACACEPSAAKAIALLGPIQSIDEIVIGPDTLDPAAYRVDYQRVLIRQDGEGWPVGQDLIEPIGAEGTWAVTYTRGVPVPPGGQIAAGILACQLYLAAAGSNECKLPMRVQTVVRQGVGIAAVLDSFEDVKDGKTGIWLIDSWVASVNRPRTFVGVATPDTISRDRWDQRNRSRGGC